MPSKYVIRNFTEGGFYHVFNRGVEKRDIFLDEQDYQIFLYYLLVYTLPPEKVLAKYSTVPIKLRNKNLSAHLDLLVFCLMPNHFHLLLRGKTTTAISRLLKQLTNAYIYYFNQKYERVGSLLQGRFRAVKITKDELLIHTSRYIHLNPVASGLVENLRDYRWSSYLDYVVGDKTIINNKDLILSYFPSVTDYERFVLDRVDYAKNLEEIKHLTMDLK